MSDSTASSTVEGLLEQLALTSTLCDVADLGGLAKMHAQMGELVRSVEDCSNLAGVAEFCSFGLALESLLEGIVLETYSELDEILDTVRQGISEMQSSLRADPTSAPLPKDGGFIDRVLRLAGGEPGPEETEAPDSTAEPAQTALETGEVPDPPEPEASSSEDATPTEADSSEPEEYVSEPLIINDDELEYVKSFVTEAYEHIESIEAVVLELEQSLDDEAKINELFRPFHTIKGMAGFLNLQDINRLTHRAETVLDLARKGQLKLTSDHIDLVFNTVDILKEQIGEVEAYLGNPTGQPVAQPDITEVLKQLHRAQSSNFGGSGAPVASGGGSSPAESGASEPQDETPGSEPLAAVEASGKGAQSASPTAIDKPASPSSDGAAEYAGPERRAGVDRRSGSDRRQGPAGTGAKKDLAVRVDTGKLDQLVNMVGELVIAQALVSQNPALAERGKLAKDISQVAKITREVQEITMSMRMVTLQQTFQKMGRLVRDVSRKAGKQVAFSFSGEETELDKNVIDEIGDPLMHMVRNAVDHGIEPPEDRLAAGKPEQGQVHLHAAHQGGNIIITISDDGRGLDRDKLIRKGVERGLVAPDAQLSESEAFALIMQAGFSTAEQVTDISGRGVGMDVVRRNIEKLRGKVEIASTKGKGSQFTISLPLTLAIIDGMVVRVGAERFVIPTISIDQSLRPEKDQIFTVQKRGEMLQIRGELCPLVRLDELFAIRQERPAVWETMVVVVIVDGRRIGIVLDDLIGQQQIVIKNLGQQFEDVRGISGAAILGDGRIGLILDAPGLVAVHNSDQAA